MSSLKMAMRIALTTGFAGYRQPILNPSYSISPGKFVQVYPGCFSNYTLYKYWYNALKCVFIFCLANCGFCAFIDS